MHIFFFGNWFAVSGPNVTEMLHLKGSTKTHWTFLHKNSHGYMTQVGYINNNIFQHQVIWLIYNLYKYNIGYKKFKKSSTKIIKIILLLVPVIASGQFVMLIGIFWVVNKIVFYNLRLNSTAIPFYKYCVRQNYTLPNQGPQGVEAGLCQIWRRLLWLTQHQEKFYPDQSYLENSFKMKAIGKHGPNDRIYLVYTNS